MRALLLLALLCPLLSSAEPRRVTELVKWDLECQLYAYEGNDTLFVQIRNRRNRDVRVEYTVEGFLSGKAVSRRLVAYIKADGVFGANGSFGIKDPQGLNTIRPTKITEGELTELQLIGTDADGRQVVYHGNDFVETR